MDAVEAFNTSDPKVTTAFYDALIRRGPIGQVAFGLFRAQKRSSRAKEYRKRHHRNNAYDAKSEALNYLNAALTIEGSLKWGWGIDPMQPVHRHVLYVETPYGQVSYHSQSDYGGPPFDGNWDGHRGASDERVIRFCNDVAVRAVEPTGDWLLMPFGKHVGKPATDLTTEHLQWLASWNGLDSWPTIRSFVHRAVVMTPVSASSQEEEWSGSPGEACPFEA